MADELDLVAYGYYERVIDKCKSDDFEEYEKCMFDALYTVTRAQDYINLKLIGDVRENQHIPDDDKNRLLRRLLINDNANAIILNIAQTRGYPDIYYLREKVHSIEDKLFVEPLS